MCYSITPVEIATFASKERQITEIDYSNFESISSKIELSHDYANEIVIFKQHRPIDKRRF